MRYAVRMLKLVLFSAVAGLLLGIAIVLVPDINERMHPVSLSQEKWTRTSGATDISFLLENNKDKGMVVEVYVAVYSKGMDIGVARGNPSYDLAGEAKIKTGLKAKEKRIVTDRVILIPVAMADKADFIIVNVSPDSN